MTCPKGKSWQQVFVDSATGVPSNHQHVDQVECSDGGICDTSTGECLCFPGFEGSACQRTSCPNECSGHGTCRSNQDFAIDFSEAVFEAQKAADAAHVSVSSYYDYFLVTYDSAWDAGMQYGCLCDVGFRGVDCSIVECPTAYDPMDEETCNKYSEWESWGTWVGNAKALCCQGANNDERYSPSLHGRGNTILISEWNNPVRQPLVKTIPYNPIEEYPCNGAPSGDFCSGRGTCDTSSGICGCFAGFTGPACEEVADIF